MKTLRFLKLLTVLAALAGTPAMAQLSQIQRSELRDTNLLGPWNPGFENGKSYWTNTGATFAITTTNPLDGTTSANWTPTAASQTLDSHAVTVSAGMLSGSCQATIVYTGGDANTTFEVFDVTASGIVAGASQVLATVTVPTPVTIPFSCPAAADSIKLRLTSTASGALVKLDKAFLGSVGFTGISSISPVVFSEPKTVVGSVGSSGQIAQGHALTTTEWPFATSGKLAYYNLNASATTDGSGALSCSSAACTLTNSATPVAITATDLFGNANSAANFVGASSEVLTNTNVFFNPSGATSFVVGGWFNSAWTTLYSLVGQWPSNSDRGWNITTDTTGRLFFQVNTTGGASTSDAPPPAATLTSGWHHVAMQFNTSTQTLKGYLDGKLVQTFITASASQRATSGQAFTIGKDGNVGSFFTGSAFGVFFGNSVVMNDDDIRKIAAFTWNHNKNTPAASQLLTGNWYRADSNIANQLTSAWVVHKGTNTLYTDFSDIASTASIDFSMASQAVTPSNIPVYSYDSGWLSAAPATTIPHGLSAIPGNVQVAYESNTPNAGNYEVLPSGSWCSYDATNLYCDWTGLTVSGSNQVRVQAWLPGTQVAVTAAGSATSGVVNTTAQTFSGAKTFNGPIDAAGGWAADTASYATGSLPGLLSATTQTIGGAKTFNGNIFVASGQGVSIGTTSPNATLEADGASGVMLATNRGSSSFLTGQGGNTSVIFQNSATSAQSNQVQIVAGASGTAELDLTTPTGGGGTHGLISYSNSTDTLLLGAGGVGNLSVTTNGVVTVGVNGVTASTVHQINGRLVQNDSGTDSAAFYMAACTTGGGGSTTWTLGTSNLPSNSNSNIVYGHVEVTVNSGAVGATNTYVCNFSHFGTGAGFNQGIGTCTALAGGSGSTTTPTLGVVSGGSNPMVWQIVIPAGGNSVVRTTVGRRNGSSWVFNTSGC